MKQILQLIRQINFYGDFLLKFQTDYFYVPRVIGREGKFLKNIKFAPKADLFKFFSTGPNTKSNGLLVINHININICIKPASVASKGAGYEKLPTGKVQGK